MKSAASLFSARSAVFSPDRRYRYLLDIRWEERDKLLNFIMLNPSTANEVMNDPTVERCERRARLLGFGGLLVTNLFAYRATQPRDMLTAKDPIGPENDAAILSTAIAADTVICAWGKDGKYLGRDKAVVRLLDGKKLYCLKQSKTGVPYHPLYLSYDLKPIPWTLPA